MAAVKTAAEYLDSCARRRASSICSAKDLLINVTGFFRDPRCSIFSPRTSFPTWCAITRRISRCGSGSPDAARARRPIPSPCFSARRSPPRNATSSCRSSPPMSTPTPWRSARDGLYPDSIEADVSRGAAGPLFRQGGSRLPDLGRSCASIVVFTVQDVLADPPFSRLDFVSCRNLLIYLRPEAQAKVISMFHFALREGGILLARQRGDGRRRRRPLRRDLQAGAHLPSRRRRAGRANSRFLDAGRRLRACPRGRARARAVAPDRARRTLPTAGAGGLCARGGADQPQERMPLFLGPTDRYLHRRPGQPTHDLLAMARQGLRTKLRSAIQRAFQENARVVTPGGRTNREARRFVQPVVQPCRAKARTVAGLLRR